MVFTIKMGHHFLSDDKQVDGVQSFGFKKRKKAKIASLEWELKVLKEQTVKTRYIINLFE